MAETLGMLWTAGMGVHAALCALFAWQTDYNADTSRKFARLFFLAPLWPLVVLFAGAIAAMRFTRWLVETADWGRP